MSRVHDALRRAEQLSADTRPAVEAGEPSAYADQPLAAAGISGTALAPMTIEPDLLQRVRRIPFTPSPDAHLINLYRASDAPAEEFRALRTRLNHLQNRHPIHSIVVTSPSPAEGKSFGAVNLAISEAQLDNNNVLLIDCDFRRPIVHSYFQMQRGPGLTDFLQGKAQLEDCIRRVEESNLYLLPAGEAVVNPLELLNRVELKLLLDALPQLFNWLLLDSPPLLFAADANLLSTLCGGTVLVVRIGATTIDSVTRAMQSLCQNNVLGIIVNGARRGELYSKYTYYHSYYYAGGEDAAQGNGQLTSQT
jgi:receptor protein-tyrosine kinase